MLHSSRYLLTAAILSCGTSISLRAQSATTGVIAVRPAATAADSVEASIGSRIRVSARTLRNPTLTGTLIAARDDSLWLRFEPMRLPLALSRDALTRLEVSGGHPQQARHARVGALAGVATGALLGTMFGLVSEDGCSDCAPRRKGPFVAAAAGGLGLFGGLVGVVTGAWMPGPELWQPARFPADAR
jgi:hypothetical protein